MCSCAAVWPAAPFLRHAHAGGDHTAHPRRCKIPGHASQLCSSQARSRGACRLCMPPLRAASACAVRCPAQHAHGVKAAAQPARPSPAPDASIAALATKDGRQLNGRGSAAPSAVGAEEQAEAQALQEASGSTAAAATAERLREEREQERAAAAMQRLREQKRRVRGLCMLQNGARALTPLAAAAGTRGGSSAQTAEGGGVRNPQTRSRTQRASAGPRSAGQWQS